MSESFVVYVICMHMLILIRENMASRLCHDWRRGTCKAECTFLCWPVGQTLDLSMFKSRRVICDAGWELRLESMVANDTHLVYVWQWLCCCLFLGMIGRLRAWEVCLCMFDL
jgi:hypothetical protein